MAAVADRFWAKVDKTETCWLWTAGSFSRGYGRFTLSHGKYVSAHRWAFEHLMGPIPEGLDLDHLCRTPACVNPAHLEPVTHAENVRRGEVWTISGMKTHCPSGHEYVGDNLYLRPSDGARVCRTCTREHQRRRRLRRMHVATSGTGY